MNDIPVTSVTLLKDVASDVRHPRWTELHAKYKAMMQAFLRAKFPSLGQEEEDIMQETMIVLTNKLPDYDYLPEAKGHFRNYLLGILNHKAQDTLSRRTRQKNLRAKLQNESLTPTRQDADWRKAVMEIALDRLRKDKSINPFHLTVFKHVALLHEKPEAVAEKFGTSRANVDVIKKRMVGKLSVLVARLTDF